MSKHQEMLLKQIDSLIERYEIILRDLKNERNKIIFEMKKEKNHE